MIKILIVDDSALIRKLLSEIISSEPNFKLVGTASNAFKARDLFNLHKPDVITLDIEMPTMDGLSFLQLLMKARPTPGVMVSTLTERGADATLRARRTGRGHRCEQQQRQHRETSGPITDPATPGHLPILL